MYGCKCQIKDMYLKRKTWDMIAIADTVSQVFLFLCDDMKMGRRSGYTWSPEFLGFRYYALDFLPVFV